MKQDDKSLRYRAAGTTAAGSLLVAVAVAAISVAGGQVTTSAVAGAETPRPKPTSSVNAQQNKSPLRPPSSASSASGSGTGWVSAVTAPLNDIQAALQSVQSTMNGQDDEATAAACRQLQAASQRLGATLPSPKPEVTAEVQGAVDEFTAASNTCLAVAAGDRSGADQFTSSINAAQAHLGAAQGLLTAPPT